jgi:hypothetical protein
MFQRGPRNQTDSCGHFQPPESMPMVSEAMEGLFLGWAPASLASHSLPDIAAQYLWRCLALLSLLFCRGYHQVWLESSGLANQTLAADFIIGTRDEIRDSFGTCFE